MYKRQPYHLWKDDADHAQGDWKDGVPLQPSYEQQDEIFQRFVAVSYTHLGFGGGQGGQPGHDRVVQVFPVGLRDIKGGRVNTCLLYTSRCV